MTSNRYDFLMTLTTNMMLAHINPVLFTINDNTVFCTTGIIATGHPFTGVEFVMTDYYKHKKARDDWYSTPFYTGHRGYKLRLCVTIDDVLLAGDGTHISVWVFLMRGEYDDSLEWPFSADITIKLVNWIKSQDGHEVVMSTIPHDRLSVSEGKHLSPGIFKFIAYNEVESTTGFRQYLKNECLMFRVTKVVVHSDSDM